MSAIYGLVGESGLDVLHAMSDRLAHRGLIAAEWEYNQNALFGERLHEKRVQPLHSRDLVLVADADIYNVDELREILLLRGRSFDTDRPEEVILQGYCEFGLEICERINGDFAFAIWDDHRSILILARDPLGSRPLYYWLGTDLAAFASEYKSLLAVPQIPIVPDLDAIQELQYTKYAPANRTLLQGINSVPPGHFLIIDGQDVRSHRYFDLALNTVNAPEKKHADDLREVFLRAVKRRLTDLPVAGVTLSGGIDSASVAAGVRNVRPDLELHTFTAGYGPDDPEMRRAALVSKEFGTIHHPIVVKPKDIENLLPSIVWHLEDPIARSETALKYETIRFAADYVNVILAGYAADGLYAGMPRHQIVWLAQQLPLLKTPLEEFYNFTQVSAPPRSLPGRALHYAYYRGTDTPPPAVQGGLFSPSTHPFPSVKHELLNEVMRSGMINGVPKWLPKAERMHMAHGVRFRVPYMDVEVMRHAFQISDRYKIRGKRVKHIFREAMGPLLPEQVRNFPKFPQAMNYDLELSEMLEKASGEYLSPQKVRSRGFFKLQDIDRMMCRPTGKPFPPEQAMRLWTAILTEIWAQTFLDQRGSLLHPDKK